jgi:WD40 repeat protein
MVSVAWHPSGEFFAASIHNVTMLLNSTNGEELNDISSHYESVNENAWSPTSGRLLAIGSGMKSCGAGIENNIKIWDRDTEAYIHNFTVHTQTIEDLAWSPDGTRLISASADCTFKVWNVATETVLQTLVGTNHGFRGVEWSLDGTLIASESYGHDEAVQIWDASSGMELARFASASESKYGPRYSIYDVA